jgi:hypothetical protein
VWGVQGLFTSSYIESGRGLNGQGVATAECQLPCVRALPGVSRIISVHILDTVRRRSLHRPKRNPKPIPTPLVKCSMHESRE